MTKQQNKKKIIMIFISLIIVMGMFIGIFLINHYTRTRMGMLRHMVYLNNKWDSKYPMAIYLNIFKGLGIVFIILNILRYIKSNKNFFKTILFLLNIVLNISILYFLVFYNKESIKSYYLLTICFNIILIFQNLIFNLSFNLK